MELASLVLLEGVEELLISDKTTRGMTWKVRLRFGRKPGCRWQLPWYCTLPIRVSRCGGGANSCEDVADLTMLASTEAYTQRLIQEEHIRLHDQQLAKARSGKEAEPTFWFHA